MVDSKAFGGVSAANEAVFSPARPLVRQIIWVLSPGFIIIVVWELGARFLFDARFVGQPSSIFTSFFAHLQTEEIWVHVWVTLREILIGYAVGTALGGGVGYVLGLNQKLAAIFEPYILALNAIPKVAIAPLLIVILGIGLSAKVAIVVSLVFFLMFYSVFVGIRTLDVDFLYQARIMGAGRWQEIRYVVLPAIMPNVLVGMKTSSVYAVIGAIIGEFVAAQAGLGFFILAAAGMFNITDIWVGVIFLMLIVFCFTVALTYAERRILRWLPRINLK